MSQRTETMRVEPRPSVGVAILVGYAVLFTLAFLASGVDYDDVADSTSNVLRAIVIPVWVGAAVRWGSPPSSGGGGRCSVTTSGRRDGPC